MYNALAKVSCILNLRLATGVIIQHLWYRDGIKERRQDWDVTRHTNLSLMYFSHLEETMCIKPLITTNYPTTHVHSVVKQSVLFVCPSVHS